MQEFLYCLIPAYDRVLPTNTLVQVAEHINQTLVNTNDASVFNNDATHEGVFEGTELCNYGHGPIISAASLISILQAEVGGFVG